MQPKVGDRVGDIQVQDAGFNPGARRFGVDLDDVIHARHRNDHGVVQWHRRTGKSGARSTGHDIESEIMCDAHARRHFLGGFGKRHEPAAAELHGPVACVQAPFDVLMDDPIGAQQAPYPLSRLLLRSECPGAHLRRD